MTIRFYANHNVARQVVQGVRRREVDILTAYDDGAHELTDAALLQRAARLERVLFTHDDDLLSIAKQWHDEGKIFPGLVYVHQKRLTVGELVDGLELVAKASEPEDLQNLVLYLPL